MTPVEVALAEHKKSMSTLLVDDLEAFVGVENTAFLSQTGLAPEEMWALRGDGSLKLVILSAPRSARETFRVLSLVERLVARDGRILILPVTESASEEVRPEATEIFCGAHPEWSRRQADGNVIELWRSIVVKAGDTVENGTSLQGAVRQFEESVGEYVPSDSAAKAGKRVVSLSVFGDSRLGTDFWKQMPQFVVNYVLAHHALFPGYELRIHHDEHLYSTNGGDVLVGLARRGLVNLVYVPSRPGQGKCERMLHRLMPAWDPEVSHVICRDVDSLPTWRDRCCVEEWIASGLDVGVIHDNREHGGMMGGLSQFKAESLRTKHLSFDAFITFAGRSDESWAEHGADQTYLNELVSDGFMGSVCEHSIRSRGVQTIKGSIFLTEIASPSQEVIDSVTPAVREGSDVLTNYMGSSGYQLLLARAFYDNHSPIASVTQEVEKFARASLPVGDGLDLSLGDRFLHGIDNWCNHRPLLFLALEETKSGPVLELGMGNGSTPYLHDYCEFRNRDLFSYDNSSEWVNKFEHLRSATHRVTNIEREWNNTEIEARRWAVALVDHSPADRRVVDIGRLSNLCDIIVIHDTEPTSNGYGLEGIWSSFEYRVDVRSNDAWATAISHTIDITKWRGKVLGGWVIS